MSSGFCQRVEELLRREVEGLKSGLGGESGMMLGQMDDRALCVDELFKLHSSLTLGQMTSPVSWN